MSTVREFIDQSYRLISASNPYTPLRDGDLQLGIRVLNQLLSSYAATGLMITIANTVSVPIAAGQTEVTSGPATFLPLPDITEGRVANIEAAWLNLTGVDYPLIHVSKSEYLNSWKYEPLLGLPRYIVVFEETEITRIRLYPGASQGFTLFLRAKFQANALTSNSTINGLPGYYERFLLFAAAKDIALYKGRADAWTDKLEASYRESKDIMEAASEVNLAINGDRSSMLNGAWRVRSGV